MTGNSAMVEQKGGNAEGISYFICEIRAAKGNQFPSFHVASGLQDSERGLWPLRFHSLCCNTFSYLHLGKPVCRLPKLDERW